MQKYHDILPQLQDWIYYNSAWNRPNFTTGAIYITGEATSSLDIKINVDIYALWCSVPSPCDQDIHCGCLWLWSHGNWIFNYPCSQSPLFVWVFATSWKAMTRNDWTIWTHTKIFWVCSWPVGVSCSWYRAHCKEPQRLLVCLFVVLINYYLWSLLFNVLLW
jgi:hypothetical protein